MDVGWCVRCIQRVYSDLAVYSDGRNVDLHQLESHNVQLQLVYRELVAAELLGEQVAPALDFVQQALQIINSALDDHDEDSSSRSGYQAQLLPARSVPGRPSFDIATV